MYIIKNVIPGLWPSSAYSSIIENSCSWTQLIKQPSSGCITVTLARAVTRWLCLYLNIYTHTHTHKLVTIKLKSQNHSWSLHWMYISICICMYLCVSLLPLCRAAVQYQYIIGIMQWRLARFSIQEVVYLLWGHITSFYICLFWKCRNQKLFHT